MCRQHSRNSFFMAISKFSDKISHNGLLSRLRVLKNTTLLLRFREPQQSTSYGFHLSNHPCPFHLASLSHAWFSWSPSFGHLESCVLLSKPSSTHYHFHQVLLLPDKPTKLTVVVAQLFVSFRQLLSCDIQSNFCGHTISLTGHCSVVLLI